MVWFGESSANLEERAKIEKEAHDQAFKATRDFIPANPESFKGTDMDPNTPKH